MYILKFKNISEIRMGSPFNSADVELSGNFIPNFRGYNFQDMGLINSKKNIVYLVQWETTNNEPGFRIWKINEQNQSVEKTNRMLGFCRQLHLNFHENLIVTIHRLSGHEEEILLAF